MSAPSPERGEAGAIEELLRLEKAATPAPWHDSNRGVGWEVHLSAKPESGCWTTAGDCPDLADGFRDTMSRENAELIAASRNALPHLLAALASLRSDNERLRAALNRALALLDSPDLLAVSTRAHDKLCGIANVLRAALAPAEKERTDAE